MRDLIRKCLSKFDAMIDFDHIAKAQETCRRIFEYQEVDELPYVIGDVSGAEDTDWPEFPYNDTFGDPAKMLLDQLRAPFLHHQLKDYHPLNIRCNYGTVILPSVLGAGYQLTETSMPWAHHLGDREAITDLLAQGIPDLDSGLGKTCFETLSYYQEVLADYPNLQRAIVIYHPDLQGPFDVAHLVWGPDILVALYDCPDLVQELLVLVTDTYAEWMRKWKHLVGEGNAFTTHWNFFIKGGIMLRDDTPVMLSSRHYEEFIKPYDQRLLDEFGGCIHFCGNGNAFTQSMCQSRSLFGIHSSQPHLNDMDALLESARTNRVVLLGLPPAYLPRDWRTGAIVLR